MFSVKESTTNFSTNKYCLFSSPTKCCIRRYCGCGFRDGKEMYTKLDARAELLFDSFDIKPLFFAAFVASRSLITK